MWFLFILIIPYALIKGIVDGTKPTRKKWEMKDWNSRPRKRR